MRALSRPRALALLIGGIAVAACGPTGVATTPPGSPAVPTTSATEAAASQAPTATQQGLPSFALPSFVGDQELEAMFPDDVAGQKVTVISMNGSEFLASGGGAELQAVLDSLGKQPADLSVAFGSAGTIAIIAFRVKGVPAAQILPALVAAYQQELDASTSQVTFGGKSVTKFTSTTSADATYVHMAGDTVFTVAGKEIPDSVLNEVFSKLP